MGQWLTLVAGCMHERTLCAKTLDAIPLIRKGISGSPVQMDCLNLVIVQMWAESGTTEEEGKRESGKSCSFTRLRHLLSLALGGASFDAATLLRLCDFLRWDHPALREVPGMRPGSVCSATPGGKQTDTRGRDGQRCPTSHLLDLVRKMFCGTARQRRRPLHHDNRVWST